jgi:hypothetical protein
MSATEHSTVTIGYKLYLQSAIDFQAALLGIAGHDLRQPLAVIRMGAHRIRPARKLANGVAPRIVPLPGRVSSSRWEFPRKLLKLHHCQNERYESRPMRRNRNGYEEV